MSSEEPTAQTERVIILYILLVWEALSCPYQIPMNYTFFVYNEKTIKYI